MAEHFEMSLLKPDKLIKVNELAEVSDPIFFERPGVATTNGLLSNTIFGISKEDRANIFAYIDLAEWFIHPLIYKIYSRLDRRIREIVHGTQKYSIVNGDFVKDDEKGKTGIKFLKDNMQNIKIKSTDSNKRDVNIKFINSNLDATFIKQYIVITAYYRDVNSEGGKIGVGDINKLYDQLLIAVRALKETQDYGLSMSDATRGRIQELILLNTI
jgi:transcriptional regulator of heat shock response